MADLDLLRADLDYFYRDLQDRIENARKMLDVITDSQIELLRRSGWVIGQKVTNSEEETVAKSSLEQRVRHLTIDLVDGDLQFRANNSWDFYWGAPVTYHNRVANSGEEFVGDPADVFPLGKSEFYGLYIPVSAGRYKITFNSHTFEYAFEKVGGADE